MAKVLLVDDDTVLAGMIEDWLIHEKNSVEVVHRGFDAWARLSEDHFDLVILDWDLPDLNGIDLLKRFRDGGGRTPIIMLTGHTTVDDKEKGLDYGANDYLTKPFHMKELSARMRAVLRNVSAEVPVPKPLGAGNAELLSRADLYGTSLASKYEFLEVLGEGGVAVVFKARHPHLDKFVAVKMLQKSEMSEETVARFEQEARAVSKLEHPSIVTVYDFGVTEKNFPFMVMEFVQGESLEAVIAKREYLPLNKALEIMIPAADGFAHAHDNGILHRDIKPSNLMIRDLDEGGMRTKILDFGLAKFKNIGLQKAQNLTQHQQVMGSPPYMSPEQVRGKEPDERTDIYSFGCVLFETLTGYPPFCGDTASEVMLKHIEDAPLTLQETRPELTFPPELGPIISRCLEKAPEHRFQSMRELKGLLERLSLAVKYGPQG